MTRFLLISIPLLALLLMPVASAQTFIHQAVVIIDETIDFGPYPAFSGHSSRPLQRHLIRAAGLFWAFYHDDGPGVVRYQTSSDGEIWIDRGAIITGLTDSLDGTRGLDVIFDGSNLHYVYARPRAGFDMRYRMGTPNSDSTITWAAAEQTADTFEVAQPSIAIDDDGRAHIGYFRGERFTITGNNNTDGTWLTDYRTELSRGTVAGKGSREGYGSLHVLSNQDILAVWGMEASKSGGLEAENLLAWSLSDPSNDLGIYGWSFPRHFIPAPLDIDLFSPTWMHITMPRLTDSIQEVITVYHKRESVPGDTPELFWLKYRGLNGWGCDGCQERVLITSKETYAKESDPNANFGTESTADIRTDNSTVTGGANERRAFLEWDLSPIPPGANILSAKLSYGGPAGVNDEDVNLTAVSASWTETGLTWNNQPAVDTATNVIFNIRLAPPFFDDRHEEANLTDIVQSWVNGTRANNGIRLNTSATIDATWKLPARDNVAGGRTNHRTHLLVKWSDPTQTFSAIEIDSPNATLGATNLLGGMSRWPDQDLSFTSILPEIVMGSNTDRMHFWRLRGDTWFETEVKAIEQTPTDMEASTSLRDIFGGAHYTLFTSAGATLDILAIDSDLLAQVDAASFAAQFGPAWVTLLAILGILGFMVFRFKIFLDRRRRQRKRLSGRVLLRRFRRNFR